MTAPAPTITPGEMRIELQLEGVRSVIAAGFLALGASSVRVEALLERIATAIETQTKLLTHANGNAGLDSTVQP